ncbi:uncharacterized protein B0I36DRAFT_365835 [Microdochium trichocladiopsis]|uniref:Uncharacterized protein n=1 Tax=Microdochium trichocladiopsis TaxID=1682393 RepID=A0A9P8Y2Z1_9PEZI|nr:uncharacterized protein B0I36DRAFT_365835 [Microdochium trichocladiopsis]KAH7026242.1 hypothetical protein B0I36DRAFT_365835 [Microdochium trichocladiopsis]
MAPTQSGHKRPKDKPERRRQKRAAQKKPRADSGKSAFWKKEITKKLKTPQRQPSFEYWNPERLLSDKEVAKFYRDNHSRCMYYGKCQDSRERTAKEIIEQVQSGLSATENVKVTSAFQSFEGGTHAGATKTEVEIFSDVQLGAMKDDAQADTSEIEGKD